MKIVITDIIDNNQFRPNKQTSKILLVDSLIEHFAPLFYEDLRKKQKQVSDNLSDIGKLKKIITKYKNQVVTVQTKVEIESLKSSIYKEIEQLSSIDVLYGKSKNSVHKIIATIDNMSKGDLEKKLMFLHKIVSDKINNH